MWLDGEPLDHPTYAGGWRPYFVENVTAPTLGNMAAVRAVRQSPPNRDGVISVPNRRYGAGSVVITMIITDVRPEDGTRGGWAQTWANLNTVKGMFGVRYRASTLKLQPAPGAPSFVTRVECTASVSPEEITPQFWRAAFSLETIDAFWRDEAAQTVHYGTASCLRGGTAQIGDALILSPGQGNDTRVRVRDVPSGRWVQFRGDVPEGWWVRIEPERETAFITQHGLWAAGTEYARGVTVGPGGFSLSPEVEFSAPPNTLIKARRAYL